MSTFKEVAKELDKDMKAIHEESRKRFVFSAYSLHRGIIDKFYTAAPGSSVGLARRTGNAARSWQVEIDRKVESITASVFSAGVPYADMSRQKTITPKTAKWLTIPVGPALTKAGAPRYPGGPKQAASALRMPPIKQSFRKKKSGSRDPLRFYKKSESLAFLIAKDGVTGTGLTKNNRIMFVLKKSVTIPARTAGLMPFVDKRVQRLYQYLNEGIAQMGVQ